MSAPDRWERWTIDPDHSTLKFSISHRTLREIRGEFRCWGGHLLVDPADPRRASVRIWVDLSSIDTGSQRRNDYILGTELFDIRWEPGLVFDGERLDQEEGRGAALHGWLTLHALRKPIAVTIDEIAPAPDDGRSPPRFVSTARASIDRAQLGLRRGRSLVGWLSERMLGDTIQIAARVEAARVERPSSPGLAPAHPPFVSVAMASRSASSRPLSSPSMSTSSV